MKRSFFLALVTLSLLPFCSAQAQTDADREAVRFGGPREGGPAGPGHGEGGSPGNEEPAAVQPESGGHDDVGHDPPSLSARGYSPGGRLVLTRL